MKPQRPWLLRQRPGFLILLLLCLGGVIAASVYVMQEAVGAGVEIVKLNFIAIMAGLVFEYRRLSGKWSTVLLTALGSYAFSFIAFAQGKHETVYIFENHLKMWPWAFLGLFTLFAMVVEYTRATAKMTEGVALLLTIAINYWIIANHYWETGYIFVKCLIGVNAALSLFSLYNAFSYKRLGKGTRLALSIWSSAIILVLAIDNIIKLYSYRDIESLPDTEDSILIFFQFFLLGISAIYIAQNLTMIGVYLPGKNYMKDVREMNQIHIGRFSKEQVFIPDAIAITALSLAGFTLNYAYGFLPVNFMIWAIIATSPFLLYLTRKVFG